MIARYRAADLSGSDRVANGEKWVRMQQEQLLGGRYVLAEPLGRGGMAEVRLAHDLRLDRPVAVKLLRRDVAGDPTYLARFRREAQSTASLNHPSIVAVFDSGEEPVAGALVPYLVMEYVSGATLHDVLRREQAMDPRRALELTDGVLEALAYAHAHGIVHRDIKPANVMLTGDGSVKVMDFGIARPMGQQGMTLTQTAMVVGTAEYLSPEQARGETVDPRADLYSVGCLLFELLTGRPPFQGDTPVAVALQHLRSEPQPPSALAPAVGGGCDDLVLRALAKDRDQRFADAAQMREAVAREVRRLSGDTTVPSPTLVRTRTSTLPQAGPPTPPPTRTPTPVPPPAGPRGRSRRTKVLVGAAAAVAVLAALGVAGAAHRAHEASLSAAAGSSAGTTTSAARRVAAPDLTGRTLTGARLLLHADGLRVQSVVVGGCPVPMATALRVCAQTPAPGSPVASGAGVAVRLSA